MLITKINDFKNKIYEAEASSINFSTISSDTINFWNDIKTLGVDLNEFKKLFIEKFSEQSYKVLEAKLSSDQLASNYEDSNTELETTEFVNEFDSIIDFCNSYLVTYSANNTLATNEDVFKPKKPKYDITQSEKSLASAVAPLISKMEVMPLPDLKTEFTNILKDPSIHASEATRKKWFDTLTKATNKYSLMSAITNLYLKAAKLGLTESSKTIITEEDNKKIIKLLINKISKNKYGNIRFDSLYDPVQTHIIHNVDLTDKDKLIKELKELGAKRFRTIKKNGFISIAFNASNLINKNSNNINEKYYDRRIIKNK